MYVNATKRCVDACKYIFRDENYCAFFEEKFKLGQGDYEISSRWKQKVIHLRDGETDTPKDENKIIRFNLN